LRLIGKVVWSHDAPRIAAAQRLSDAAAAAGIPAQHSAGPPRAIDEEYTLFLGHWIEGGFSAAIGTEMDSLGATVARLHRFLRDARSPGASTNEIALIEALSGCPRLAATSREALDDVLRRCDEVRANLGSPSQPIHNDLHVANVLFDAQGRVAGVLDFEEAVHSTGSPVIDLSWVVERFCFARGATQAETLAARFLAAYRAGAGRLAVPRGAFFDAIRWRSLFALGLLADAPSDDIDAARAEWGKFEWILAASPAWRPGLERLESALAD